MVTEREIVADITNLEITDVKLEDKAVIVCVLAK